MAADPDESGRHKLPLAGLVDDFAIAFLPAQNIGKQKPKRGKKRHTPTISGTIAAVIRKEVSFTKNSVAVPGSACR